MKKKTAMLLSSLALVGLLTACGSNNQPNASQGNMDHSQMNHNSNNQGSMDHMNMNHSTSGEVPKGIKEAKNPTYKVGSQVVVQVDHMPGMKGATATIDSAQRTTAYMVDYTPTMGVNL